MTTTPHAAAQNLPPAHLRRRVSGIEDPGAFLTLGRLLAREVLACLAAVNWRFPESAAILDFGCGCGRVARHLLPLFPESARFVGMDVDQEAIDWNRRHLSRPSQWIAVDLGSADSELPEASFDLIFGISVFTHLPEDNQFRWLRELMRILKPDGVMLQSIHSPLVHSMLSQTARAELERAGFFHGFDGGTPGLPEIYQSTFQTHAYILENWSRIASVDRILERAFLQSQDCVVLKPTRRAA